MPRHIRIANEFEDALFSVETVARRLPETEDEPLNWKWVIIGMHNALQGAMVCALSGTDGTGALTPGSQSNVMQYLTKGTRGAEPFMADFISLLERAADPALVRDGPALDHLSPDDHRDLVKLNDLRRGFSHFTPKGWSIETAGLPRIILIAAGCIERLLLKNNRALVHLDQEKQQKLTKALTIMRDLLK